MIGERAGVRVVATGTDSDVGMVLELDGVLIALAACPAWRCNDIVKTQKSRIAVLQKHFKKGSTFYPPYTFKNGEPAWRQIDWRRDYVPELLWLGLLVDRHGYHESKRLACELGRQAQRLSGSETFYDFGTVSGFGQLSSEARMRLRSAMSGAGLLDKFNSALRPLVQLFPSCPLAFLCGPPRRKRPMPSMINELERVLGAFLDRHHRLPMLAQAIHYAVSVASNKHHPLGTEPDVDQMEAYPRTPESRHIAGFFRASVTGMTYMGSSDEWVRYFWMQGRDLAPCQVMEDDRLHFGQLPDEFIHFHLECSRAFIGRTTSLWRQVERHHRFNIHSPIKDQVLLGLACRVYRLAVHIATVLQNWVEDVADIYIRLAVESFINYQWLKQHGTQDHFEKFCEFGLGQQKLLSEHLRSYLAEHGLTPEQADLINPSIAFLHNHKMPDFIPVNVGHWLGRDLRRLAEDANCKDMYALMFSPCSSAVHGYYDSLERFYLRECANPFHRGHRLPAYWCKSALSAFGVANVLAISDLILSDIVHSVGGKTPKRMPGKRFMDEVTSRQHFVRFLRESSRKQ